MTEGSGSRSGDGSETEQIIADMDPGSYGSYGTGTGFRLVPQWANEKGCCSKSCVSFPSNERLLWNKKYRNRSTIPETHLQVDYSTLVCTVLESDKLCLGSIARRYQSIIIITLHLIRSVDGM